MQSGPSPRPLRGKEEKNKSKNIRYYNWVFAIINFQFSKGPRTGPVRTPIFSCPLCPLRLSIYLSAFTQLYLGYKSK